MTESYSHDQGQHVIITCTDGTLLTVTDIEHEVYVSGDDVDPDELAVSINRGMKKPFKCGRTGCAYHPKPPGEKTYGMSHEPCLFEIRLVPDEVIGIDVLQRKSIFRHQVFTSPFIRVRFRHSFMLTQIEKILRQRYPNEQIYGGCKSAVESLQNLVDIASYDWVEYERQTFPCSELKIVRDRRDFPKQKVMTFDIETIGLVPGIYVDSESLATLYKVGSIAANVIGGGRVIFMLGPPVPGCICYESETEMLQEFQHWVLEQDPDLICGYNSNWFDIPYLDRRFKKLGITMELSRVPKVPTVFMKTIVETTAAGTQEKIQIDMPGRVLIDVLTPVRKLNLASFILRDAATALGVAPKGDLHYSQLYDYFYGTVEMRAELARYNMQDVDTTEQILEKLALERRLQESCRLLRVRASDHLERGLSFQNFRFVSSKIRGRYLVPKTQDVEIVITTGKKKDRGKTRKVKGLPKELAEIKGYKELWEKKVAGEKYGGAEVLNPKEGYYRGFVTTLDFNSLYPSIIQTKNVSPDTILPYSNDYNYDKEKNHFIIDNSPPFIREEQPPHHTSALGFAFAKEPEGIYAIIERELVQARNDVKKEIAIEKAKDVPDKSRIRALNIQQETIKVCANALYGQMGAVVSLNCLLGGAASVTAWGARLLRAVVAFVDNLKKLHTGPPEEDPNRGTGVIYGDTDSAMIKNGDHITRETVFPESKRLQHLVNVTSGILSGVLKVGVDDVSHGMIMYKEKKKYAKNIIDEDPTKPDYIKYVGIGKKNNYPYCGESIIHFIELVLKHKATEDELVDYLQGRYRELVAGRVPKAELLEGRKLSKPIEYYPGSDAHVVAARRLIAAGHGVHSGDRIKYFYCNISCTKVGYAAIPEILLGHYQLDIGKYAEIFKDKLSDIAQFNIPSYKLQRIFDIAQYEREEVVMFPPPDQIYEETVLTKGSLKRPSNNHHVVGAPKNKKSKLNQLSIHAFLKQGATTNNMN